MKYFLFLFLTLISQFAFAADIKISALPLGTAAGVQPTDSFPYVAAGTNITKRLTLYDLINIPTFITTYARLASSPTFTGNVTAPTFIGILNGNATTATALAANPTDCSSGQYANAIAANGNLTCSAVATSEITGTVGVAQGGTGLTSGTSGGVLAYTASGTIASSGALTANRIVLGGGAGAAPTILGSLGTTTTLLHGNAAGAPTFGAVSLTADVSGITPVANGGTGLASGTSGGILAYTASGTLASSAALTNHAIVLGGGAGVVPYALGSLGTSSTVLHGAAAGDPTFGAVALASDVSGTLPIANGGTNSTATATAGGIGYGTGTAHAYTAAGTAGQVATSNGAGAVTWSTRGFQPLSASYNTATAGSYPASETVINFGTLEYDANSIVTTGASWKATIPSGFDGKYQICANVLSESQAYVSGNQNYLTLRKNGTGVKRISTNQVTSTGTFYVPMGGCATLALAAADYVDVVFFSNRNAGNATLATSAIYNYININRVE